MRKILSSPLLLLALVLTVLLAPGCDNKCKDVICRNNGVCNEETGECDCPDEFFGPSCDSVDLCILNDIECFNDGFCVDGACICFDNFDGPRCRQCKAGYEDTTCNVEIRDKMIGTFISNSRCDTVQTYGISIQKNPGGIEKISIVNIENSGVPGNPINFSSASATVVKGDSIFIDDDQLWPSGSGGGTYTGKGAFLPGNPGPDVLVLDLVITINPDSVINCTITGNK